MRVSDLDFHPFSFLLTIKKKSKPPSVICAGENGGGHDRSESVIEQQRSMQSVGYVIQIHHSCKRFGVAKVLSRQRERH